MRIRAATADDADGVWAILEPTLRAGDTYAVDPAISRDDALAWWLGPPHEAFVAAGEERRVLGTYYLMPNQGGGGAHVANCGYVVAPEARGHGLARAMCEHSLEAARARGYRAVQFNFVVATNAVAIRLWRDLGFAEVGRIPDAFRHPTAGLVDALVMHRRL